MGKRSAILLPIPYWLVESPPPGRTAWQIDEFFEEVGSWELRSQLEIAALRGAALVFDFTHVTDANIPTNTPQNRHFNSLLEATQARVRLINAFSLCLHSATILEDKLEVDGFRVTHADLIHMRDDGKGMSGTAIGRLPIIPGFGLAVDRNRVAEISNSTIQTSCELLDFLTQHEFQKALELVVLMNDALTSYKTHDFSSSLVTSWTVCEVLLEHHWIRYVKDSSNGVVSRTRMDRLTGRDFTASIVSEVLELADVIDEDLFKQLNQARKGRNAWMHSIKAPDRSAAADGIHLAMRMLGQTLGKTFPVGLSLSASGF